MRKRTKFAPRDSLLRDHVATFDYGLADDAGAPPVWARFYDLERGISGVACPPSALNPI
jgi:hypothetical protein